MDGEAVGTKEGISLNIAPIHAHKCQRLDKILKDLLKKDLYVKRIYSMACLIIDTKMRDSASLGY